MNNIIPNIAQNQAFLANPVQIIENTGLGYFNILKCLLKRTQIHAVIYIKQETIGKEVGLSRQTVSEYTTDLHEMGFIKKIYRHEQTCIYEVNSIFFDTKIRKKLESIFSFMKYMPLFFLSSVFHPTQVFTPSLFNNNLVNRIPCNTLSLVSKDIVTLSDRSKKEGNVMEVSKILDGIPGLNLGAKCKLSVYPDKVVVEALKSVQGSKEIANPFGYLWSTCNKVASKLQVKPDWNRYYTLKKMYGVNEAEELDIVVFRGSLGNSSVQGNKVTPQEKADKPYRHLSDKEYYAATNQSVLRPMGWHLEEKKAAQGKLTEKEIAEYKRKIATQHWIIYRHLYVKLLEDNKANGGKDHESIENKPTPEWLAMKEEVGHSFNITDDNGKIINKKDESVSLTLEKLQRNFNAVLKTKHPEASNVLFIADDLDHQDNMLILSPLSSPKAPSGFHLYGGSAIEHGATPPTPPSDNTTVFDFLDTSVADYYDDDIDSSIYI